MDNIKTEVLDVWLLSWISDSGQNPVEGSCEHGNEHLCSIKGAEFLDLVINRQRVNCESVP
jgi:hypothetical protein